MEARKRAVRCNLRAEARLSSLQFTCWSSSGASQIDHTWLLRLCWRCWSALTVFTFRCCFGRLLTFSRGRNTDEGRTTNPRVSSYLRLRFAATPPWYIAASRASAPALRTAIVAQRCRFSLSRNWANGLHYFFKQPSEIRLSNRTRGTRAARGFHVVWIEAAVFPPLCLQHQGVPVVVH